VSSQAFVFPHGPMDYDAIKLRGI